MEYRAADQKSVQSIIDTLVNTLAQEDSVASVRDIGNHVYVHLGSGETFTLTVKGGVPESVHSDYSKLKDAVFLFNYGE